MSYLQIKIFFVYVLCIYIDIASALNVVLSNISSDVEEFLQLLEQNVEGNPISMYREG